MKLKKLAKYKTELEKRQISRNHEERMIEIHIGISHPLFPFRRY